MADPARYWRGPVPGQQPPSSAPAEQQQAAPLEPQPTRWKKLPGGRLLLVNPNMCLFCHRPPHAETPHHPFEPDEATELEARRLGWPLPPTQERMI